MTVTAGRAITGTTRMTADSAIFRSETLAPVTTRLPSRTALHTKATIPVVRFSRWYLVALSSFTTAWSLLRNYRIQIRHHRAHGGQELTPMGLFLCVLCDLPGGKLAMQRRVSAAARECRH